MHPASQLQFFEVLADRGGRPDQWFLDEPRTSEGGEIDAREFTEGRPYRGPSPVTVPIYNPGRELAFNFGAFEIPVVSTAVARIVRRIAPQEVEFFSIEVPRAEQSYEIVNAICGVDCLDEQASEVTRWTEVDDRPDRLGTIHVISTIRLDPSRAAGHHIFRLKDWPLALFVSNKLKIALESIPDLGIVFKPVT